MGATIRVPSDVNPALRAQETRSFGTVVVEGVAREGLQDVIMPPGEAAVTGGAEFSHPSAGVPGSVVYDRTKTVVKRHVAPGKAVPLNPAVRHSARTPASETQMRQPHAPSQASVPHNRTQDQH